MKTWSFYDLGTGAIIPGIYSSTSDVDLEKNTPPGAVAIEGELDHNSQRINLETGEVVDWIPPKPSGDEFTDHAWDAEQRLWVETDTARGLARRLDRAAQLERDARIEGGFAWNGVEFHSDAAKSQPRLRGLYTDAISGNFTPGGEWWKLKDGSWRLLTAEDAIGIWLTFKEHMRAVFGAYGMHQALLGMMAEESDLEGLKSYDVTVGWP